ncbi:MAG: saccharopine dehydrogenase NADP-binding domain-containing protein [Verrucomicrobiae bacterium]|nr:saccharopine dehydrogenase NADP-binding domain-containing protein [Verrucomicrobiae bacterium]
MAVRQPNLLVVGASGNVARAFLRRLGGQRGHFGQLLLLDKNSRVLEAPHLDHKRLEYQFVRRHLRLPEDEAWFARLLQRHQVQIVLDVSTHPTLPILAAVNAAGASYLNTSLNDDRLEAGDLVRRIYPQRERPRNAAHILCTGMNPGVVNMLVCHGIEHFGKPRQILHLEYDTSVPVSGWRPIVTWSKQEFLTETAWNRTGYYNGKTLCRYPGNAIEHREPIQHWLRLISGLDHHPKAFLVLHEENLTVGRRFGVPSRFLYALHPRTMRYLVARHRQNGTLRPHDLEQADNVAERLEGSDLVAVCLEYAHQRVYYVNQLPNSAVLGTNATCAQVAVGIFAALFTLLYDQLKPRIYFVEDLYDTLYKRFVFSNLRIERFVCVRRKGRWVVREHIPEVRVRAPEDRAPAVL